MIPLGRQYFITRYQAARMLRQMRRARLPGGVSILRGEFHRHYSARSLTGYVHIAVSALGASLHIQTLGAHREPRRYISLRNMPARGAV